MRESKGGSNAKNTSKVMKSGNTANSLVGAILNQAGATIITNNTSDNKKAGSAGDGGATLN